MQIQFERSGGFAGMVVATSIDTETLPPEQARELEELVNAADFFNLPASFAGNTGGADRFEYRVMVKSGGQEHRVAVGDASAPDSLMPLLERLTALARSSRA